MHLKVFGVLVAVICLVRLVIRGLVAVGTGVARGLVEIAPVVLTCLIRLAALAIFAVLAVVLIKFIRWRLDVIGRVPTARPDPRPVVRSGEPDGSPAEPTDVDGLRIGNGSALSSVSSGGDHRNLVKHTATTKNTDNQQVATDASSPLSTSEGTAQTSRDLRAATVVTDRQPGRASSAVTAIVSGDDSPASPSTEADEPATRDRCVLMVRTDIGVAGDNNAIVLAFVLHLRSPRIDLAKVFEIEAVKRWLDALSELRIDQAGVEGMQARRTESHLRERAAAALKAGPGWLSAGQLLDLSRLGRTGAVRPLTDAATRLQGPAIFRDCGAGFVGDEDSIEAELHYHCADIDIDAAALLAREPALISALITAILNCDKKYRSANFADEINKVLTESSAVRDLPNRFPATVVEPTVDVEITNSVLGIYGRRNDLTIEPTMAQIARAPALPLPRPSSRRRRRTTLLQPEPPEGDCIDFPPTGTILPARDVPTVGVDNEPAEGFIVSGGSYGPDRPGRDPQPSRVQPGLSRGGAPGR